MTKATGRSGRLAASRTREGSSASRDSCSAATTTPSNGRRRSGARTPSSCRSAGVNLVSVGIFAWSQAGAGAGRLRLRLARPRHRSAPRAWRQGRPCDADGVAAALARSATSGDPARHRRGTDPLAWCAPPLLPAQRGVPRSGRAPRRAPSPVGMRDTRRWRCGTSTTSTPATSRSASAPASTTAFRGWLRERYETLDGLNAAWGTAFWSQHYGEWDEIYPPRLAPTNVNPTQQLDWRRFTSDSWIDCFDEQAAILRHATPDLAVTTNFMGFHPPIDYWKLAAHEDVVSNDSYPDTSDPEWMIDSAMTCDLDPIARRRPAVDADGAGDGARQLAAAERHETAGDHATRQLPGDRAGAPTPCCSSSGVRRAPARRSSTARWSRTAAPTPARGAR